jgi:hypothetical protein
LIAAACNCHWIHLRSLTLKDEPAARDKISLAARSRLFYSYLYLKFADAR